MWCWWAASGRGRSNVYGRSTKSLERMTRRTAILVTVIVLAIVVAWNLLRVSLASLFSAFVVLIWIMYAALKEDFRAHGLVSGQPVPKSARWFLVFLVAHSVIGVAYSYYKHAL